MSVTLSVDSPPGSSCSSNPETTTVRPLQINLKDHCVLCLEFVDSKDLTETLVNNPRNLINFQPLIYYLTAIDPTDSQQQSKLLENNKYFPVIGNLPPMCAPCYEILGNMYNLHQQLVSIQAQLQKEIGHARKIVTGTFKERNPTKSGRIVQSGKKRFFRAIGTGMSCSLSTGEVDALRYFLDNFHALVVDAQDQYKFPGPPSPPSSSPGQQSSIDTSSLKSLSYPVQFVTPFSSPSLSQQEPPTDNEMIFVSGNDEAVKYKIEQDEYEDPLYIKDEFETDEDDDAGVLVNNVGNTQPTPYQYAYPVPNDIPVECNNSVSSLSSKSSTVVKDLTCDICGKKCFGNTSLLRHVKLVHKKNQSSAGPNPKQPKR